MPPFWREKNRPSADFLSRAKRGTKRRPTRERFEPPKQGVKKMRPFSLRVTNRTLKLCAPKQALALCASDSTPITTLQKQQIRYYKQLNTARYQTFLLSSSFISSQQEYYIYPQICNAQSSVQIIERSLGSTFNATQRKYSLSSLMICTTISVILGFFPYSLVIS